jgi:hypothetical protein
LTSAVLQMTTPRCSITRCDAFWTSTRLCGQELDEWVATTVARCQTKLEKRRDVVVDTVHLRQGL